MSLPIATAGVETVAFGNQIIDTPLPHSAILAVFFLQSRYILPASEVYAVAKSMHNGAAFVAANSGSSGR